MRKYPMRLVTGLRSALLSSEAPFLLFLAIVAAFVLVPALAYAQVAASQPVVLVAPVAVPVAAAGGTALQRLSSDIMAVLEPVFVALVGALAVWLLSLLKKKLGIKVSDETASAWSNLAKKAALRGAEWARQEAKKLVGDAKVPGPAILDTALGWAVDMGEKMGLPEMLKSTLTGLIESELFKLRLENGPPADPMSLTPKI